MRPMSWMLRLRFFVWPFQQSRQASKTGARATRWRRETPSLRQEGNRPPRAVLSRAKRWDAVSRAAQDHTLRPSKSIESCSEHRNGAARDRTEKRMVSGRRSAWSRLREGPEWNRATENRGSWKRTEIAPVKGIGGLPIHEKDLALGNPAAALPNGQRPASVVSFASERHHDAIDHDGETDAADGLTRKGEDVLQKRDAARQIVPLRQKPSRPARAA